MYKLALFILTTVVYSVTSEHPTCFSGKLDLVLVIDVSGSDENRFLANRDAALDIAKSMPISWDKTAIAIIQFSKLAIMKLEFGSSGTWEVVNDTISTLDWTGDVSLTAEAMDLAMIMFRRSRPDAQRAIVLFSDGNSFNTWQEVISTSERLKYSEAKIFAVSLAGNTYETELKQYVQHSNGSIIRRQSEFQELKRELQSMTVARCPPPAATPPQDFIRPAPTDEETSENQLPTRRHENQLPTRRVPITTRRAPINARTTPLAPIAPAASATAAPRAPIPAATVVPRAPLAQAATTPVPLGAPGSAPIAQASVGDINLDKRRRFPQ